MGRWSIARVDDVHVVTMTSNKVNAMNGDFFSDMRAAVAGLQSAEALPIVLTGHGSFSMAVEATKRGASNFLSKPFENEKLLVDVKCAVERRQQSQENNTLRRALCRPRSGAGPDGDCQHEAPQRRAGCEQPAVTPAARSAVVRDGRPGWSHRRP